MQFERLGPYRVGEELGKGGMGAVYRAEHIETGELVAVKALTPQLAMAEGFRERFEAEIESLKKLRHEGIVRLVGYGEQNGILFYAMELVEGTSLEEEISAGRRFNWREVTEVGVQVCRALKHAHDHGIVHRDIKPANLLLNTEGKIKIADFGIARLFGGTQLTSAGGVLGTADYMSPEQAEGRAVTEKCDQYSLGGVMYALLAGRPPFRAKNLPEMLQMQRFAEPEPVRRFAPDTPEQLEQVISQLLAKDPNDRFRNVLVLGRHLEAMQKALSRPAKDDFALLLDHEGSPPEEIPDDPNFSQSLALETTRIEPLADPVAVADPGPSSYRIQMTDSSGAAKTAADHESNPPAGVVTHRAISGSEWKMGKSIDIELLPDEAERSKTKRLAPQNRFTTVEEEALLKRQEEKTSLVVHLGRIFALMAVLASIIWAIQYLTRPPMADDLYAQIAEAAFSHKVKQLYTVQEAIEEFLTRFPDDPRTDEVANYRKEIEYAKLEDQLDRIANQISANRVLLPVEYMYVQAIQLAETQPNQAIQKLEAILAMYPEKRADRLDEADARMERCLHLIKRRLAQYTRQQKTLADIHLPNLKERLACADSLAATDPHAAQSIYQAIVDLYSHMPWAQDVVGKARAGIERLHSRK
ncbi:MAG: serine/threonine protein kinase [Pirellulales bacterium]|nr:serine/threonine protein kinase [Pirellulales bacterium]